MHPLGVLVLIRHGQSTDNELNLFSGWRDPELTGRGIEEARNAGLMLKAQGFEFQVAFTSKLGRARLSLEIMLAAMDLSDLPVISNQALNERDYGDLSGLNKDEARSVWGAEQVQLWRKSYDAVPPGGESLAMTAARMLPFWKQEIEPRVSRGECVLVLAHGNSLRSIVTYLEDLSPEAVVGVHIETSGVLVYDVTQAGKARRRSSTGADVAGHPVLPI